VLPRPQDAPTGVGERLVYGEVAGNVALELRTPVVGVGLRLSSVLWASVPEATVDEYGESRASKDDVGSDDTVADSEG